MELDSQGNVLQIKIFSNSILASLVQTVYFRVGYLYSIEGKDL